ncbi:MAG: energy transducer TonB, partial [Campylobacter sp.]|nr:energy transducer TonB [Campylobacter sp.]
QNVGEFKTQVQGNEAKALKASWQGLIKRHVNKFKKYPQKARRMGKEGIVTISVSIDKNGNVLSASIKKSSEFADLDEAGLELFKKASPIPAAPSEIIGMNSQMTFNMPINYNLKDR